MNSKCISQLKNVNSVLIQFLKTKTNIIALILIAIAITLPSITPLLSGDKINHNEDFYLYAGKHEAARKAFLEYHNLPLRSFWLAGGYPTLGDPEDPALNPLILMTLFFGTVTGLKVISFLAMLTAGLSTYALARYILGYTQWGSLFSGLIFGLNLFIPLRILDGNYNEVYAAFLPLCLLLIGLACRGKKIALLILIFVFYTMLSDGKQTALMAIFYMGVLCVLDMIPQCEIFGTMNHSFRNVDSTSSLTDKRIAKNIHTKSLKVIILALTATFFVGMMRFLPTFELIGSHGGFGRPDIYIHTQIYEHLGAFKFYTFQSLLQQIVGLDKVSYITMGWLPVLLALIAFVKFSRRSLAWMVILLLFGWMIIAYNAPIDLLKILWNLPIFNTISDTKYLSYQIIFTLSIVSGQFFWLVEKIRSQWLGNIVAIVLILIGVLPLYSNVDFIQRNTYNFNMPAEFISKQDQFYNIKGKDLGEVRKEPLNSLTYTNLIRGIGTIDINVAFLIEENAVPKYFVDPTSNLIPNLDYRGEAYFTNPNNLVNAVFRPNSIMAQVSVQNPDTLIINQNYHRDWHTDQGEIFDKDGLIALQLDKTGNYKITLRYISRSFFAGLFVSILSMIILIFICWSYKTGRLMQWSKNSSIPIRGVSRFILWLID